MHVLISFEIVVDSCLSNPCQHGGTCMAQDGGFVCTCPANYRGTICNGKKRSQDFLIVFQYFNEEYDLFNVALYSKAIYQGWNSIFQASSALFQTTICSQCFFKNRAQLTLSEQKHGLRRANQPTNRFKHFKERHTYKALFNKH